MNDQIILSHSKSFEGKNKEQLKLVHDSCHELSEHSVKITLKYFDVFPRSMM